MPDPIITGDARTSGSPASRASLAVAPESLLAAADALRLVAADLVGFGEVVGGWQRPVGTDEVMGSGNADRSWRHLAELWGEELRFYGAEAADLADSLSDAAMAYRAVESEVSVRCRG